MSRKFDHTRLSPAEFAAGLAEAGLSHSDFERLTGTRRDTFERWLRPVSHPRYVEPPFWVSSWLALYLIPGAAARADQVAAYLIREIDHDAA
jgi:hypothetical protein